MPISSNKKVLVVKIEPTYGVDAAPAAADAMLCSNLDITPLDGSAVERDFIRPFFGHGGSVRAENFVSLAFDIEWAGAGAAATPPKFASLFKACNLSELITLTPITGTAQAGGTTNSIKLATAGSSPWDDVYEGMTINITGGTGSANGPAEIISYSGTTKIATLARTWAVAPDATSLYSIGANVMYTPNSNFGTTVGSTSVSIAFFMDGIKHVVTGARGSVSFEGSAKQLGKFKFKFVGLLGGVSDAALLYPDLSAWQVPLPINYQNTTDLHVLGSNIVGLNTLSIDIANDVKYRQRPGVESVLILDRKPVGNINFEMPSIATKEWFAAVRGNNTGPLCIKHGQTPGNIVGISAPKVQVLQPKYADDEGVSMIDMGLMFLPSSGTAGNDELRICFK